jgi:hypothetical protein
MLPNTIRVDALNVCAFLSANYIRPISCGMEGQRAFWIFADEPRTRRLIEAWTSDESDVALVRRTIMARDNEWRRISAFRRGGKL